MYYTMVKTVCLYRFSSSRNKQANIGEHLKKTGLILSSDSVNMLILGVVMAVRVGKIHSKSTPIKFFLCLLQFDSTPLSLLYASKVATGLWIRDLTTLRTVIIFVLISRQLLIFRMRWKSLNLFVLECSFHRWKPFCFIYNCLLENGRQNLRFELDQINHFTLR